MRFFKAIEYYFIPSFINALLLLILIKIVEMLYNKIKKGKIYFNKKDSIFQLVLLTYVISVLYITDFFSIFEYGISNDFQKPNIIPLIYTILDFINNFTITFRLVFYNTILFLPFGFFVPFSFTQVKWDYKKITSVSIVFILIIELLELLSGRCFDIDDVIINCLGSLIGFSIYTIIKSKNSFNLKK